MTTKISSRLNRAHFNVDVTSYEYCNLANLYKEGGKEEVHTIQAVYINRKGNFGDSPTFAIASKKLVNIPSFYMEQANEILSDDELINAINEGKVGFTIYPYENKQKKECYGINFIDL